MEIKEAAKKFLSYGYSVIPVGEDKISKIKWTPYQSELMTAQVSGMLFNNSDNIAIVTGLVSKGLECIDIDCKYDLTGALYDDYMNAIKDKSEKLYDKLVICSTKNKGYHLLYRWSKEEPSKKLAQRAATESEEGDKVKVLLETRGEKGYFLVWPSKGYSVIKGKFSDIKRITIQERDILFSCAEKFNTYTKPKVEFKEKVEQINKGTKLSALDDYDIRGNALNVMENAGWSVIKDDGKKISIKRPGKTTSIASGYFDKEWNRFSFFSTSTEFKTLTPYKPSAIYSIIECNGNYTEAARKLSRMGYGDDAVEFKPKEVIVKSTQKRDVDPLNYLANKDDILKYLQDSKDDNFAQGLSTGIRSLDEYYLHKRKGVDIWNGHTTVGKSTVLWYLMLLSAMIHDFKIVIHADENEAGDCFESLMQFYKCKKLMEMNDDEYDDAYSFVDNHFKILSNKLSYTYKDIMMVSEDIHKNWKFDMLLIDPYNGLDSDLKFQHGHDYQALNHLRKLSNNLDITLHINTHSVTKKARELDDEKKNVAPEMADTEGGMKFASKSTNFGTVDRDIYATYPDNMINDIYIRKIKNKKTGGNLSPRSTPVSLKMLDNFCGFLEKDGWNPVLQEFDESVITQELKEFKQKGLFNNDF